MKTFARDYKLASNATFSVLLPLNLFYAAYSCAWQKDILVHGRLHLTQNLICFYSNILGWETKVPECPCRYMCLLHTCTMEVCVAAGVVHSAFVVTCTDNFTRFSYWQHRTLPVAIVVYHFILFIPFIGFSNWQLVLSHSSVNL